MKRRYLFISILSLIFGFQALIAAGRLSADEDIPGNSTYTESVSSLKQGILLLDRGEFRASLEKFKTAHEGLPVIGDYILFFMADARSRLKEFVESNKDIDQLLRSYSDTPLRKKARYLRIRNSLSIAETSSEEDMQSDIISMLIQYTADYPDDSEAAFLYARLLRKKGEAEKARVIFKRVYIANTPYSEPAFQELTTSDITPHDMLEKTAGLIRIMEYRKAEIILRKILTRSDGKLRDETKKQLGTVLFRQKKYREAAGLFLELNDTYNASRSLFRAGDFEAFMNTVQRLISEKDGRAGVLLASYASKKRRDGNIEDALRIFSDVRSAYPSDAEDAMWGTAWVYYRTGEYRKAADILTELYDTNHNSKYLYWKSVSLDKAEGGAVIKADDSPKMLLTSAEGINRDFYRVLALLNYDRKLSDIADSLSTSLKHFAYTDICGRDSRFQQRETAESGSGGRTRSLSYASIKIGKNPDERFEILMAIGMKNEAAYEMTRAASLNPADTDALLYVSRRLHDAGSYNKAIRLVSKLGPAPKAALTGAGASANYLNDILYPMAFWPVVDEAARQHNIDPFIILAVMREESRFDPEARSVAGALGLMQIMPHAAAALNSSLKLDIPDKSRIYDIRINITLGAHYLNALLRKFNSLPAALASYNAGEDRVLEWLRSGNYKSAEEFIEDIPYDETRNYVKRVLVTYYIYTQSAPKNRSLCVAAEN